MVSQLERSQIKLELINVLTAKFLYDYQRECLSEIFNKGKKNKSGSITIPKRIVDKMQNKMYHDLSKAPENERNFCDEKTKELLSIIRTIVLKD